MRTDLKETTIAVLKHAVQGLLQQHWLPGVPPPVLARLPVGCHKIPCYTRIQRQRWRSCRQVLQAAAKFACERLHLVAMIGHTYLQEAIENIHLCQSFRNQLEGIG